MIVFPAIDLIGGKVIRLERGDRKKVTVYSDDPLSVAKGFLEQGATWLHVVDLSAAFEEDEDARNANTQAIKKLCKESGLNIDVGGGVRSLERIDEFASFGAKRIALGTVLIKDPEFAERAACEYKELLVADVASKDGFVKINGWRENVNLTSGDVVETLVSLGFKHLVFTDISRDGMQTGIDVSAYEHISRVAGFPVVASGGISSLDDIKALVCAGDVVFEGCIIGRALYEGAFTLKDALVAAESAC